MTSRTLRRRLLHGDVDGKRQEHLETSGLDGLDEPLLGNSEHDDGHSEGSKPEDLWDEERRKENLHWTLIFSQLIAQWAEWLANIVLGSGSLIGRLLAFSSNIQRGQSNKLLPPTLSPLQEERLRNLQQRLEVPFDGTRGEHQVGSSCFMHILFCSNFIFFGDLNVEIFKLCCRSQSYLFSFDR
ncbi:hypothetical protein I3842_Q031800 [Carya illinoinensis]|uniref:Uncharacterized protein n=1 Tax=Carya illinoinensis TaxID=32201 RepID=A0A922D0I2_CARIL|nr:hypothetical protein I3842_Q031800 [Carya illinoinensis]